MKKEAFNKLQNMITEGSVDAEMLLNCISNWMSGDELTEFVERVEDELFRTLSQIDPQQDLYEANIKESDQALK